MLQVTIDTDVAAELITTAEAKQYIKENYTAGADATLIAEDTLIDAMVAAARIACENFCNSTFKQKTLVAWWDTLWQQREFTLPYGPHVSISLVQSVDAEGDKTTLTLNTDYYKRGIKDLIITVNQVTSAPITAIFGGDPISQLEVTYIAGYASGEEPIAVIQAMYDIILQLYIRLANDESGVDLTSMDIVSKNAQIFLTPYKRTAI